MLLFFSQDLWSTDTTATPDTRKSVAGLAWVGGVCDKNYKYSISEEYGGFKNVAVSIII